ncbi:MAG: SDR family oxidoreductase [Pseudomonadales bacterium]|nr:SDR family oxidoreductase [Pseudomonadales bacterium]MDG1444512.1 SDR family oxidoreductase [Pseudomonadales bacterium]
MDARSVEGEIALIVGGGPGISASCARLFSKQGMRVAIAARHPDKPVLNELAKSDDISLYACDASDPAAVEQLFGQVTEELGTPRLVVHNIDGRMQGIFRKGVVEVEPDMVKSVLENSAYSAFLVARSAAKLMLAQDLPDGDHRGTILFTNASASLKGYANSGAFAMACHAKTGLAQSIGRELMPQGIHIANIPIDAAIGWTQQDGSRQHRLAGTAENDNMADPDHIAQLYLQLHQQHRSTWAFEVVLRPWVENW